jgi:hypothetical protein
MSPDLPDDVAAHVFIYLRGAGASGGEQA